MALTVLRQIGAVARWQARRMFERRNFQDELDTMAALTCVTYLEKIGRDRSLTQREMQTLLEPLAKLSFGDQRQRLFAALDRQVAALLAAAAAEPADPYPRVPGLDQLLASLPPHAPAQALAQALLAAEQRARAAPATDHAADGPEAAHPGGFTLQVRRSSVQHQDAGFGVFVRGEARAGTVLALYPGLVYLPVDPLGERRAEWPERIRDNGYLIGRYDGVVLDGRSWHLAAANVRARLDLLRRAGVATQSFSPPAPTLLRYRNPFAVGNFVNHPPPGKQANVLQFSYNYREEVVAPELRDLLPHEFARRLTSLDMVEPGTLFPGLLLLATRNLRDEEVFLNYRYHPRGPQPPWYHQPNPDEARRRWAPVRLLSLNLS